MMDRVAVDANVTTEQIGTSSSVNETFSIGTITAHRECDDRNVFDYCSVPEVDCEDEFIDCETVGMYTITQ